MSVDENTRAFHAKLLLENPIFQEAMEEVNKGINKELDKVKTDDTKAMMGLVMQRQAVNKIAQFIITSTQSDKVVAYNAKQKKRFML